MICPKCSEKLIKVSGSFVCVNHHTYDIAKQGYVNLNLDHSKTSGDSKEMVNARHRFLNNGYYQKLRDILTKIIAQAEMEVLADLGCGEGYYTRALSQHVNECVAFDLSKDALKTASREDKKTQYAVASIFHLPLANASIDGITNIFAPLPLQECERILKENGILIRVSPDEMHLYEFKELLYEKPYKNEIDLISDSHFTLIYRQQVSDWMTLDHAEDIEALFTMTPYYWKSSKEVALKVKSLSRLSTRFAFDIQVYQKKS